MVNVAYINSRGSDKSTSIGSYRDNLLQALQIESEGTDVYINEVKLSDWISKSRYSFSTDIQNYDVVHFEPDPHWYTGILLRRLISGTPKVAMTLHGVSPILYGEKTPIKQRIRLGLIIKRLLPLIDGIFTVSNTERHLISSTLNYPEEEIFVTYNGNNFADYSFSELDQQSPHDRKYILHVSNQADWRKDPELLLDTFGSLVDINDEVDLLIVGGWEIERVYSLIEERGIRDRTKIVGKVQPEELPQYYAHAEIYLQTSVYESFCMPVIEAMNFGTPVVTTTAYALPEIAQDAAIYVDRLPSQIAKIISELLKSDILYEEKVKKGKRISKSYTWQRSAKSTLQGYLSL